MSSDNDDDEHHHGEAYDWADNHSDAAEQPGDGADDASFAQDPTAHQRRDGAGGGDPVFFDPFDGVPAAAVAAATAASPSGGASSGRGPARHVVDLRGASALPPDVDVVGTAQFVSSADGASYISLDPMSFLRVRLPFSPEDVARSGGGGGGGGGFGRGGGGGGAPAGAERTFNFFSITFDVRLPYLPPAGISLFQTAFPDPHETDEAWLTPALTIAVYSDMQGEPLFKVGKWNRVVLTVGGPFGHPTHDHRQLTTYINGRKCSEVTLSYGPDSRFGLRRQGFLLFASNDFQRMQCPIDLKYLRVTTACDTPAMVLKENRTDSIFSQFANHAAANGTRTAAALTLAPFLPHPHPMWMDAAFLAMFGDPYLNGTGLGQNEAYLSTAQVLSFAVARMLDEQKAWLVELSEQDSATVQRSVQVLEASLAIFRRFQLAAKGPAQLIAFLKFKDKLLQGVTVGESALMPCGWRNAQTGDGSVMLLELHRVAETVWDVVVVNVGAGVTGFHPGEVFSPKIKYKTSICLPNVPAAKILDDAWWAFLFSQMLTGGPRTTAAALYSHLLPFLTDQTFESHAARAADDPSVPYRTLPRSGLTMHRNFIDWMLQFWRRNGVSLRICKILLFNLRRQYVRFAVNDLSVVGSVTDSDKQILTLALEQTARRAIRLHEVFGLDGECLSETMSDAKILQLLDTKPVAHSENVVPPHPLDLTSEAFAKDAASQHFALPCMERLLRKDDTDGLIGKRVPTLGFVPIDFLQIPDRCTTFEDALTALRYVDKCCTMVSVQSHSIKNANLVKVGTIQLVFTQVLPVPLGPHADRACLWMDTPLRYGVQLDVLLLLTRLMEHFASSCLSLQTNRSFDAVRIVVSGVMVAIADCVMRKRSTDHPSEVFETLRDKSYGVSMGMFAPQSETIEVTAPEVHVARTAVMDYFARVDVKRPMFLFERSLAPDAGLVGLLDDAGAKMAFPSNPIAYTVDSHHYIIKNFPEFQCYRDLCFFWKFFMNTEEFPEVQPYTQRHAELEWGFDQMSGTFVVKAFGGRPLSTGAGGHRWASGAIASRYTAPVPVFTEDDILHVHSFACFEKTLTQKDVELLLSFLIVPYLRIPLTLNFFATADRIHTLRDKKLRHLLDSVVFEPSRYLELGANYAPTLVPSEEPRLIASPYGLLFNELHHSPEGLIRTVLSLVDQARKLDVGTVYSSTVGVILYVVRLLARIESAIFTVLRIDQGTHPAITTALRDVTLSAATVATLTEGLGLLQSTLRGAQNSVQNMLEAWLLECHQRMQLAIENPDDLDSDIDNVSGDDSNDGNGTESDLSDDGDVDAAAPADDGEESLLSKQKPAAAAPRTAAKPTTGSGSSKRAEQKKQQMGQGGNTTVDRNVRIACRLHAHLILLYRNTPAEAHTLQSVTTLLASHQYLQTRHTWNHLLLEVPETEIFEAMAIQRRGLVQWFTSLASPSMQNHALEAIVRVTAGTGMRHPSATDSIRTWDFITGPRSLGRYTIASTERSVVAIASIAEFDALVASGAKLCVDFFATWCPPCKAIAPVVKLMAQQVQGVTFCAVDIDLFPAVAQRYAARAVPTFVTMLHGTEHGRLEGADPNRLREIADRLNSVLVPADPTTPALATTAAAPMGVAPENVKFEEVNLQTFTLLLKSGHLRALEDFVQGDYDVQTVFKTKISMQCAVVEEAQHRNWFRLIGRFHDIQFWKTPDPSPPLQVNDREYDPGSLGRHEGWILPLFEPVRLAYFNDPMNPIEFVLPEEELTAASTVAYIVALHPKRGGTWKEVFVFRAYQTVHVYDVVSYGRRNYRTLVYTTDARSCLREMQPDTVDRASWWPSWCRHGCGTPSDDPPPGAGAVILRDMRAPGNVSGTEEMFVPQRFLFGLLPQTLVDSHLFWQDAQDNVTGYPLDPKATHVLKLLFAERRKFTTLAAMPSDCLAQVRWVPQLTGEASAFGGPSAAVALPEPPVTASAALDPELQLLNLLHAPAGSALHSLARTLARLENMGHILVWTTTLTPPDAIPNSSAGGLPEIYQVQLPRLKLTFSPKRNAVTGERCLFSVDHVDLFITNDRPSLVVRHMRGLPHSLLLSTINQEYHVLVPSIRPVRPFIASSPFSTELVLDRSSGHGAAWRANTATPYYVFPVHISMSFLQSTTLAAALYLLQLRFSFRDYEDVARLVDTVATDTDFSGLKEELQGYTMLGSLARDQNPNAHASRLKISVVMADSPVPTPWLLDVEMAELIAKAGHLRSACQLAMHDRLQLLEECLVIEKMLHIAAETIQEVGPDNIKKILMAIMNPEAALELTFQERKQHDGLFANVTDKIFASVRRRVGRQEVIAMLVRVFKGQQLSDYKRCLWTNNKAFLERFVADDEDATGTKAAGDPKPPRTAPVVLPKRSAESKWRTAALPFVFTAQPPSWRMVVLNDESPRAVSDGIVLDVISALLSGQTDSHGGKTGFSFLFFYQLFQRVIKFRLGNCADGFHFAALALPFLVDYGDTLLCSILQVVSHNPQTVQPAGSGGVAAAASSAVTRVVASVTGAGAKFLPRFNDTRRDKSGPLSTVPEEGQKTSPLHELLTNVVGYMQRHRASLTTPIGDALLPARRAPTAIVPVPSKTLYLLAVPTNMPYGDLRVPTEACGCNPVPFNTLREKVYLPTDPVGEVFTAEQEQADPVQVLKATWDNMRFFTGTLLGPVTLDHFVRQSIPSTPIADSLPFDVSKHPSATSHVASKMLERFRDETKRYADQINHGASWKLHGLHDDVSVSDTLLVPAQTDRVLATLEELCMRLRLLRDHDAATTAATIDALLALVNRVEHVEEDATTVITDPSRSLASFARDTAAGAPAAAAVADGGDDDEATQPKPTTATTTVRQAKLYFELRRFCHLESTAWTEYLVSSLISDVGMLEWSKINPFVSHATCRQGEDMLLRMLLHANRVGHANRALQESLDLRRLLAKTKAAVAASASASQLETLRAGIVQKSDSLGSLLTTKRHYIETEQPAGGLDKAAPPRQYVDPRFLLFEFTWNLVLRQSQITMVRSFMNELNHGRSSVWQMIMGAGKTTVVGPLLALLLATGKQLVVQVVPPALLEFSRSVMRSTFSSVIKKRIYTFAYDRSTECNPTTYRKLLNAQCTAGVVIATPTSIKSLMLKFIETLDWIADVTRPRPASLPDSVQELHKILALFRQSVLMLDEVDLILHPLKSELNFPIGAKEPLDFSPLRWQLPVHLLDAVFYAERGTISTDFRSSTLAKAILENIKIVIERGYRLKALQRNPHPVLLDPSYYHTALLPLFAQWSVLWIEAQNFAGLSREDVLFYIADPRADHDEGLKAKVTANVAHRYVQMLNLAQDWLRSFLPHILAKIDRVSFGIMTKADKARALHNTPNMPRSRLMLAIPFVGKDVPSDASEFAHPDIIIGMTILAYRYEGLRFSDFKEILASLREVVLKESGPWHMRKTNQRYVQWVRSAGGKIRGTVDYRSLSHVVAGGDGGSQDFTEDGDAKPTTTTITTAKKFKQKRNPSTAASVRKGRKEVVSLRLLKQSSKEQIVSLFQLLRRLPDLIHWYLNEFIFPTHMRFQHTKISASGQDIGGSMLFPRRVGFSGTPSDLLPVELGRCQYEAGSDGLVIHTLTSPKIVSYEVVEDSWSPVKLLDKIAIESAQRGYHALIDTGALITGMSNLQVAQYLLDAGLAGKEGVVYLDEQDRKMILVRATGRVMKLDECGIPLDQRFAFYDQIHTTGMDIRHTSNAVAVLTLGKDMTFRDYAQGAFRMRGINKGQKIHLVITPEVRQLMARELATAGVTCVAGATSTAGVASDELVLREVCGWLVINSMLSERLQFNQLCLQNVTNVYRKNGFSNLMRGHQRFRFHGDDVADDHCLGPSLEMFREPVEFKLDTSVPKPRLFSEIIAEMIADKQAMFITTPSEVAIITSLLHTVQGVVENGQERAFNQDMVREQEEEKEKMKEIVEEKELEITQFKDQQYMRDMEEPTPWLFCNLSDPAAMLVGEPAPLYAADEFKLFARQPLLFPHNLLVSNNYFDKRWSGQRRVKNVVVCMEWVADRAELARALQPADLAAGPPRQHDLRRTVAFMQDGEAAAAAGHVALSEVAQLCATAFELQPSETLQHLQPLGATWPADAVETTVNGPMFRQEELGRKAVCLSLIEAETIRRILHVKQQDAAASGDAELIGQSRTDIALRCVCCDNYLLDQSPKFTAGPSYQTTVAYEALRFLDCETHFRNAQINHLLKGIQQSQPFERRLFFEQIIGCKRRNQKNWDRTPVSRGFTIEHEYTLLHLRTLALRMRALIRQKGMLTYDAFALFDHANNGSLGCANLLAGMRWLGLQPTHDDVLSFVAMASAKRDSRINYPEWVDMMATTQAQKGGGDGSGSLSGDLSSKSFSTEFLDEVAPAAATKEGDATTAGDEASLPREVSSIDEDSANSTAAATMALPFGDRIRPVDEEIFDVLYAARDAKQNEQKRLQEEAMQVEEKRIRRVLRQHKKTQQAARGADDNPSARGEVLWFDFGTGHLPDDVTTVGYTYFEPAKAAIRQQLRADPASMVVLPIGVYGMEWEDLLPSYTVSMYVSVPRVTTEEQAAEQKRQKLAAAVSSSGGTSTPPPAASASSSGGEEEDDDIEETVRGGEDPTERLLRRMQDPRRVRQPMVRSLSDEHRSFPVAGSPLVQVNRQMPGAAVICVTADGRVGLPDENRTDLIVTGTKALWQWQSDAGWADFDREHNSKVERQYQRDPNASATFGIFGIGEFVVNFRSMQQRNQQNGASRPVRRHQTVDGNRIAPDTPTLVTIAVDAAAARMRTYVNGLLSAEYTLREPRRFALDLSHQVFLFGHTDPARMFGGAVEWASVTSRPLSTAEVARLQEEVSVRTGWTCKFCTIRNDDSEQQCKVCEMPRSASIAKSSSSSSGGDKGGSGGGGGFETYWICGCSNVNAGRDAACSFCQSPKPRQ